MRINDYIAFTDYLDFHLYLDGRLAESVRIGEPRGDQPTNLSTNQLDN